MITIENIALDSLPAELQAFFLSLAPRQSVNGPTLVCADQTEQKNAQKVNTREQTAPTALRCADVVSACDDIEVHQLELTTVDPESFTLVGGEW